MCVFLLPSCRGAFLPCSFASLPRLCHNKSEEQIPAEPLRPRPIPPAVHPGTHAARRRPDIRCPSPLVAIMSAQDDVTTLDSLETYLEKLYRMLSKNLFGAEDLETAKKNALARHLARPASGNKLTLDDLETYVEKLKEMHLKTLIDDDFLETAKKDALARHMGKPASGQQGETFQLMLLESRQLSIAARMRVLFLAVLVAERERRSRGRAQAARVLASLLPQRRRSSAAGAAPARTRPRRKSRAALAASRRAATTTAMTSSRCATSKS